MKLNKIHAYEAVRAANSLVVVRFYPEPFVGFSHRVIITENGKLVARDWLRKGAHVNADTAAFFLEKHAIHLG